jgi:hypothetical protein
MNFDPAIDTMRTAVRTFDSGDTRETLHAVQAAQDALDAVKAVLLADLSAWSVSRVSPESNVRTAVLIVSIAGSKFMLLV